MNVVTTVAGWSLGMHMVVECVQFRDCFTAITSDFVLQSSVASVVTGLEAARDHSHLRGCGKAPLFVNENVLQVGRRAEQIRGIIVGTESTIGSQFDYVLVATKGNTVVVVKRHVGFGLAGNVLAESNCTSPPPRFLTLVDFGRLP